MRADQAQAIMEDVLLELWGSPELVGGMYALAEVLSRYDNTYNDLASILCRLRITYKLHGSEAYDSMLAKLMKAEEV